MQNNRTQEMLMSGSRDLNWFFCFALHLAIIFPTLLKAQSQDSLDAFGPGTALGSKSAGITVEFRGGNRYANGALLYEDDQIAVYEYRKPLYPNDEKDVCRRHFFDPDDLLYREYFRVSAVHNVNARHVFDQEYLNIVDRKIWENVAAKCEPSRRGPRTGVSVHHFVNGMDFLSFAAYHAGSTRDSSRIILHPEPIVETFFKPNYENTSQTKTDFDSRTTFESRQLTAEYRLKELNPKLLTSLQSVAKNWMPREELQALEARQRYERGRANKEAATALWILALYGLYSSSPCNDPERRKYNSNCGP
jgi:hypothetical protein